MNYKILYLNQFAFVKRNVLVVSPLSFLKEKNEDQVMKILKSFSDMYNNIKACVLLMEHIPAITKIYIPGFSTKCHLSSNVLIAVSRM